jgi:hypothetical protein
MKITKHPVGCRDLWTLSRQNDDGRYLDSLYTLAAGACPSTDGSGIVVDHVRNEWLPHDVALKGDWWLVLLSSEQADAYLNPIRI